MRFAQIPDADIENFEISEFCVSHRMSRSLLYKLWKEGSGPEFMKVGTRTLISKESAARWRKRMERETSMRLKRGEIEMPDPRSPADIALEAAGYADEQR